jgi:hypothetical protein
MPAPSPWSRPFPKELTTAYKKAFEAKNPGIKLEILNKNTVPALPMCASCRPASGPT